LCERYLRPTTPSTIIFTDSQNLSSARPVSSSSTNETSRPHDTPQRNNFPSPATQIPQPTILPRTSHSVHNSSRKRHDDLNFGSRHQHFRPHTAAAPQSSSMHARNDQEQTDSQPRRTTTAENRRPTTAVGESMTRRFEVEKRAESPEDADGDFEDDEETMMQEGNMAPVEGIHE